MLYRKIKSAKFFTDQGLTNVTFKPGEYGIYDGFDIIRVDEESMSVEITGVETDITIEYKNEWVRHPLKNDEGDYPENILDEMGEELIDEIESINSNNSKKGDSELSGMEVDTSKLLFFLENNNRKELKDIKESKKFKLKSLGGNTFNLSIGLYPESTKFFIQLSLTTCGLEKDKDVEMGVRLLPSKSQIDCLINYLTLIRSKINISDKNIKIVKDVNKNNKKK